MTVAVPTAAPWWTQHVELTLELGIGRVGNAGPIAIWDQSVWDGDDGWAGLEPEWVAVDNCRILEVGIERGRNRSLDRFGASSMTVTANDPDGWLSWAGEGTEESFEVRPGRLIRLRARLVATGEQKTLWRGWIESLEDSFEPWTVPAAKIDAQDGLAQLAHVNEPERTPEGAGERSDERIGRLLDVAGWPAWNRALETGRSTVQATNLARSIADDLGITADSEGGVLYSSRDDYVTFRNRDWLRVDPHATAVQATVGGDGQDVCAAAYEATRRGSEIVNDVQLARAGGTIQRFTDPTSIGLYNRRTFQRTDYVCETDEQIGILAGRMLQAWGPARARIPKVVITPHTAAEWQFVCAVDYGWRLQLHYAAQARALGDGRLLRAMGEGWVRDVHVQGMSYSIGPEGWTVELAVDDVHAHQADTWDGPRGWDLALWAESEAS